MNLMQFWLDIAANTVRQDDQDANKYETAVGYDSNGVLSDMLSTDAQHLAFQKFGRTAGFDSLPLLKAIVVNVGNPAGLVQNKSLR